MSRDREPAGPPPRPSTVREDVRHALRGRFLTLRELSAEVRVSEKDLPQHLEHVARSARADGERLEVDPARCLACGFAFQDRTRLTRPSRCPRCKGQRLSAARYRITG
jgi:predicted Zn-ribbon and HTH transcriptional regulator